MHNNKNSKMLSLFVLTPILISAVASAEFLTAEPSAITLDPGAPVGSSALPIISSGETINGFTYQGLPDGIGMAPPRHGKRSKDGNHANTVEVFISHEETTVPFFGTADFQDGSVSQLTLNTNTGAVSSASVALPASEGLLRLCSATMAGPAEGLSRYTYLTGEEANDIVDVPAVSTYGADPAIAPQRQAGYAVVLDVRSGAYTPVPGLGRMNHENTIVVPGRWKKKHALLTTDDTFNSPGAQLYLYLARNESHIWNDRGSLWAFQVTKKNGNKVDPTDPFNGANDYLDVQPGDNLNGRFIRVPKDIAKGQTALTPQDALEQWSNENNVFQFIRLEDLDYDRNNPRVVYIADTGRSRIVPDPATGRMMRGPGGTVGMADNGRVYRMVLNKRNPKKVDSFSILADGDALPGDPVYVPLRSPDNLGASGNSLMVQEDSTNAKIWRYDLAGGAWTVVATVNDPSGESTGIVDASKWFGSGAWLLNVQNHGVRVLEAFDPATGITHKLESGQLLLLNVPGT